MAKILTAQDILDLSNSLSDAGSMDESEYIPYNRCMSKNQFNDMPFIQGEDGVVYTGWEMDTSLTDTGLAKENNQLLAVGDVYNPDAIDRLLPLIELSYGNASSVSTYSAKYLTYEPISSTNVTLDERKVVCYGTDAPTYIQFQCRFFNGISEVSDISLVSGSVDMSAGLEHTARLTTDTGTNSFYLRYTNSDGAIGTFPTNASGTVTLQWSVTVNYTTYTINQTISIEVNQVNSVTPTSGLPIQDTAYITRAFEGIQSVSGTVSIVGNHEFSGNSDTINSSYFDISGLSKPTGDSIRYGYHTRTISSNVVPGSTMSLSLTTLDNVSLFRAYGYWVNFLGPYIWEFGSAGANIMPLASQIEFVSGGVSLSSTGSVSGTVPTNYGYTVSGITYYGYIYLPVYKITCP